MQRIDTHCHIDLYPDPTGVVQRAARVQTTIIGVTNLPSAFEAAQPHVGQFRNLRLALGLHPLMADRHSSGELEAFKRNAVRTSYIGEVGLDFSSEGRATRSIQQQSFEYVLSVIRGREKLLTIHSRGAEHDVVHLLSEYGRKGCILHWFSGSQEAAELAIAGGHSFSINPAMINSRKGRDFIASLPHERILLESDGPFVKLGKRSVEPKDLHVVEAFLANCWLEDVAGVQGRLANNFRNAIAALV